MEKLPNELNSKRILEPDLRAIRQVHDQIVAAWQQPLTPVKQLEQQVCMSSSKFRSLFLQMYGQSIYQYHLQIRLNHAKKLIRSNEYTITQIAYMVGFSHHQSFIKSFKKQEGLSPTDFKNKSSS